MDSGGPVSEEAAIRARLRAMIASGFLPRSQPPRLWAGPCREEHVCTGCGGTIKAGETEYEVPGAAGVVLFFHRQCIDLWALEEGAPAAE